MLSNIFISNVEDLNIKNQLIIQKVYYTYILYISHNLYEPLTSIFYR